VSTFKYVMIVNMRFSKDEHKKWFNGQPRKPMSAAVLFLDEQGKVLLVKSNYRQDWGLPGGVVEEHESPLDGAVREVKEELGLAIDKASLQLCAVDYRSAKDDLIDKLYFYFLGGILDASSISRVNLQADELDEMRFVNLEEARSLLSTWTHQQVAHALSSNNQLHYFEDSVPTGDNL